MSISSGTAPMTYEDFLELVKITQPLHPPTHRVLPRRRPPPIRRMRWYWIPCCRLIDVIEWTYKSCVRAGEWCCSQKADVPPITNV